MSWQRVDRQGNWESGLCLLCGSRPTGRPRYRFSKGRLLPSFPLPRHIEQLNLFCCPCCELAYIHPRLAWDEMLLVYKAAEYFNSGQTTGYTSYTDQETALRLTFRRFLETLAKLGLTGGFLADIGCGSGYLLDEARGYFDVRMGTDLCLPVATQASLFCNGTVCGGPADLLEKGVKFDTVTAVNVLEHLYEPVDFLGKCRLLVKDKGFVVLVTPDMDGPWRRCMGRFWPSFKLPEHIAYYNRKSICRLAKQSGMQLVHSFYVHETFPLGLIMDKFGLLTTARRQWTGLPVFLPAVLTAFVLKPDKGIFKAVDH
jgi:SAM-dependent methyltransferase